MPTDYKQYNYSGYSYCGGSFPSQGCGPTSVADLLNISPLTVADWMTRNGYATTDGHGTYWTGISAALTAFGAGGKMIGSSLDGYTDCEQMREWRKTIQSGYMGVLLMHGTSKGCKDNLWTTSGHYIAVVSYDAKTDRYLIYDPASATRTGWHPWDHLSGDICCLYTSTLKWGEDQKTSYTVTLKQVQEGDKGKHVLLGQRMLKSRGLYAGKLDSEFGPKTKKAVLDYQKFINKHGGNLKEDGILGPSTWQNMFGFNGIVKGSEVTMTFEQIKPGDKIVYVYGAQQILAGLGLYVAVLDFSFGPATEAAVREFQKQKKIAIDSVIGPTTWKMLLGI